MTRQNQTAPHEVRGSLLWDDHGASPYWALRRLYQSIGGGLSDVDVVHPSGEVWTVSLGYQKSGLQPRPQDDVDQLYEYRINAYADGQRKLPLLVQPRLNWGEERRPKSVPRDLGLATNVKLETAVNLEPEEIQDLVPWVIQAVAEKRGLDWNSRYFTGQPHEYSTITQYERYVRIEREQGKKIVASDGTFYRLFQLLADEQGSKMVFSADNTQVVGHNHQLRLDPAAASQLLPARQRGKQFKHYHPKHARTKDPSDPLYHPKVAVLFKKGWNDNKSVPWAEHRELKEELDANLMNLLSWSGVSTRPGSWFVPDDHFDRGEADHQVEFVDDPTPEIETDQESVLVRTLIRASDRDQDVINEIAMADGGEVSVQELEDALPYATSTLYAALNKLDDLIENNNGSIQFVSVKIRQMVRDIMGRVDGVVKAGARAVENVLSMDPRDLENAGRAWQNYINRYAAELVENVDEPDELRFRTIMSTVKSAAGEFAPEVVEYGGIAWAKAGRDPQAFRNLVVQFQNPEGSQERRRASRLLQELDSRRSLH